MCVCGGRTATLINWISLLQFRFGVALRRWRLCPFGIGRIGGGGSGSGSGGLFTAFIYDNDLCQRFIEFFTPKRKRGARVRAANKRQAGRQAGKWPLHGSPRRQIQAVEG